MEMTLITRWVEHKQYEQTKEVIEGTEIEYYGNDVNRPSVGKVVIKFGLLVIEWEDTPSDTPLDNSEQTIKILKDCGFAL